jgi:apolipoprotein N-acyltransferase
MAPVYAWPLMVAGYSALIYNISKTTDWRQSGIYTFLFFLGYFLCGLYWISNSLLVEFDQWWWALPFSFFGLPILLSLFPTIIICVLTRSSQSFTKWAQRKNIRILRDNFAVTSLLCVKVLVILTGLILADIARALLFTGFPWNMPVHAFVNVDAVTALLPHIGFYGVNAVVIFILCAPAVLLPLSRVALIPVILLFGFLFLFEKQPLETPSFNNENIVLIQGNIAQHDKWDSEKIWDNFEHYITLSRDAIKSKSPHIIVWPETALSQNLMTYPRAQDAFSKFLNDLPDGSILITGILTNDQNGFYNSIYVFDNAGGVIATYDKHHLVPFGEYMPFGLDTLTGFTGFQSGDAPSSTQTTSLSFLPLICYESLFPKYSKNARSGDILMNLTNDAWFGHTAGPFQHFDHMRFRAMEAQKSAIRLSGNGISGFILPNGRILNRTRLNKIAILRLK